MAFSSRSASSSYPPSCGAEGSLSRSLSDPLSPGQRSASSVRSGNPVSARRVTNYAAESPQQNSATLASSFSPATSRRRTFQSRDGLQLIKTSSSSLHVCLHVGRSTHLYCIVLYLFKRILQKQMDAYHGSLPHKYRKKNGEMGRGEWKMKHGKKGNKYLNIEV